MLRGLLLLDRDGTLIEERNYLSHPDGVALLPGAAEGLKRFQAAGFRLVMVTNQSGIGRGYFTVAQMEDTNRRMSELFAEQGVGFDDIFYCPHTPDDGCECRKPNTAMAERALAACPQPPGEVIVIGDKAVDIELGKRIKARTVLVLTGYGKGELESGAAKPDFVASSLMDAADALGI